MFKLKPINIYCDENITTLIKDLNKTLLNRLEIASEQHHHLTVGGNKVLGAGKWKDIETQIKEFIKRLRPFNIVDILSNLYTFCEYLDYMHECDVIINNLAEKFNSHEIVKISSNGSTRSASEAVFEYANSQQIERFKSAALIREILDKCAENIKISTKIDDTEILTGSYNMGVFTAKILSAHIHAHYGRDRAEEFLDNMTEVELSTEINGGSKYLPPIQSMLYAFKIVENEFDINTNMIITVPNSMEVTYKLRNLVSAEYAAQKGGIADVYTTMKFNIASRLDSITEVVKPDNFTPDIDLDIKFNAYKAEIVNFGGNCLKMERPADWQPFCGAKSRLLKINEMKESLILEKVEGYTKQGWNETIWKTNDIMVNSMEQIPNNDLVSLIVDMATEEFNIKQPTTDQELKRMIVPAEISANCYLMKAIYQIGSEETKKKTARAVESRNDTIDRDTAQRELSISQLHHTRSLATGITLTFRQKWPDDVNYDDLQTIEAKRINFIKRLREMLQDAFDVTKIHNCYLFSAKNFAITNSIV